VNTVQPSVEHSGQLCAEKLDLPVKHREGRRNLKHVPPFLKDLCAVSATAGPALPGPEDGVQPNDAG
jgi:hypothetical protein